MRLTIIFILVFLTKVHCQEILQKPLLPNATKQETMNWVASKFKYHFYNKTFTVGTDDRTYAFESYKDDKITIREHINWHVGSGPERKYYYYTLYLNKIEKIQFNEKTGSLKLLGKNVQEMVLDDKKAYFFNYFDVNVPVKKGEQVPIFYEASPWLLKSLAGAFKSIASTNK